MRYQFLCHSHVAQLSACLETTGPMWSSWVRKGEQARDRSDIDLSIQYFGCAYDLSVLKVNRFTAHGELNGERHIDLLLRAGNCLLDSLALAGHIALRRLYSDQIQQILCQEQLRTPTMAERLPKFEDCPGVTLDGYSTSLRRAAARGDSRQQCLH